LSNEDKSDGKWDIGERLYIPFSYDIDYLERYNQTEVKIIDSSTNALAFIGNLNFKPMSDLEINVYYEPQEAHIGDYITIVVTLSCPRGDVGSKDIEIRCSLPDGLRHNWNTTTRGTYSNTTGIWHVDKINVGEIATLTINTTLVPVENRPFTQLAMVLDGSGSISDDDWKLMRTGLANAIRNESVFPHDGSVELTVVQFGGNYDPWWGIYPYAIQEEGPTVVTNLNYNTIADNISHLSQIKGATPIGCGIRRGTDEIKNSPRFNDENRSVLCLVTDGLANCIWNPSLGDYKANYMGGNGWIKGVSDAHTGSTSAHAHGRYDSSYPQDGPFRTKDIDTSNATAVHIEFWYKLDNTESGDDLVLYLFDGVNYHIAPNGDLGGDPENVWLHYDYTLSDSRYFVSNFHIMFYSDLEYGEGIWIDDVIVETQDGILLSDSFENAYWNAHWTDPGRISAEDAREYMVSTLNMSSDQDEFDALAVGSEPDIYWLRDSMVWPQPGYIAPPYDQGSGWVKHINGYSDFEEAVKEMFKIIFQARTTTISINALEPVDPNSGNNEVRIEIIPKE
ncbi:MAG: hypothetical protein DRN12_06670, partial [Thermoplasmata archaeon]